MNICSHQRSLIRVSSNSQFSISWGRSAEIARLGQWTWVLPQNGNSYFLSFSDPRSPSVSAQNFTLFTNWEQWGVGGCVITLRLILIPQDSINGWKEKPQLSFYPCSLSARLPPSRAWQHQLYSTSECQKTKEKPWGGIFLASTFSHPNTFGNVAHWQPRRLYLMTLSHPFNDKGLLFSDNKSNILSEIYMLRNTDY